MALSAKLNQDIASSESDPRHYLFDGLGNGYVTHPDETLLYQLGGDIDKYDLILKDAHAKAILETRDRNVVCREWKVEPASNSVIDKKAADLVKDVLNGVVRSSSQQNGVFDFDQFCSDLNTYTLLKGNVFLEIKWGVDGKTTYIESAIPKPNYRFKFKLPKVKSSNVGYYLGYEIRVLSQGNMFEGVTVPPKRILCHSYGRVNDNPWGVGLGRVLYWLAVVFKKELIKQRLIYLDKYAQPTLLGKGSEKSTREQREEFNRVLGQIMQGGYGVLPPGWEASFLEAQRSSTTDVYQGAIDWCNSEMSKLVLGETLSLELPQGAGSRAAAQTHQDGSTIYLAKYDSDRISTSALRELSGWITELNLPEAKPPMIWRVFPELSETEDLNMRISRDSQLNQIGYKISAEKVKEVYGDGYVDLEAASAEQEKQQDNSGAFDVGFTEKQLDYEIRKFKAFQKRFAKIRQV